MSRSGLQVLPPLLKPTLPSPTRRLQRRPRLSLSLPNRLAQSFQSRLDRRSFSSTISTRTRSSSMDHPASSIEGDDPYAESPSPSPSPSTAEDPRLRGGLMTAGMLRSSWSVGDSSSGVSRARKSSADKPNGMARGTRRRRFGVRTRGGVRWLWSNWSCIIVSPHSRSCSNVLRRLLFAPRCACDGLDGC